MKEFTGVAYCCFNSLSKIEAAVDIESQEVDTRKTRTKFGMYKRLWFASQHVSIRLAYNVIVLFVTFVIRLEWTSLCQEQRSW